MELTARRPAVSAYALKLAAIATMLVDHTGAAFEWQLTWGTYLLMRRIGRTAFPIFCFLLTEGFAHTRSRWKYLRNLSVFALISEIPFDVTLLGWPERMTGCNVFFTLALGLLGMMAAEGLETRFRTWGLPPAAGLVCGLVPFAALAVLADWLRTDYGEWGILLIALVFYFRKASPLLERWFRNPRLASNLAAAAGMVVWMAWFDASIGWRNEIYGVPGAVLVLLYDGRRGRYRLPKWFFYAFYPAHLTILALLRYALT